MDALSQVLASVRLEGAVFLNAEFTAPWCIRGQFGLARAKARLPTADHVLFFHVLVQGHCKVRLVEETGATAGEVALEDGDVVLLSRDDHYLMGSDLHLAPLDTEIPDLAAAAREPGFVLLRHGGSGDAARFVCGYLGCSSAVIRPLIAALPRIACIPIGGGPAMSLLRDLLRVGVRESLEPRPGAGPMLSRLAELIFVEALRRYAQSLPADGKGWLAATRDLQVGRVLALIHGEPGRRWTVDELASRVALSRSALADRFASLVGEPPIQYLTRWRLALAAQSLRSAQGSIAQIALRSGYETQAAFNRAFKREFGTPPAAWRKAQVL
jgi:AraC family transcriptional regulator, alkane utilization regulator